MEEAAGGVVALGLGLELDGDGACAKADDSINPLSAVVINNFCSIDKPPWMWLIVSVAWGTAFRLRVAENRPPYTNV
jgi:hypothetical protein